MHGEALVQLTRSLTLDKGAKRSARPGRGEASGDRVRGSPPGKRVDAVA
jgi:hypothetical protein